MSRSLRRAAFAAGLFVTLLQPVACAERGDPRLQWWRDAHYGMFIHWGPYSVAGGEWKGKTAEFGETLMLEEHIPNKEYRTLVDHFDPQRFNAAEWVKLAKDAGMKYIVVTAKHHDGFAMFGTRVSGYNMVDATPFHRDPIRELALEAKKQGIRFGVYYSHIIDWSRADATPDSFNNDWEFKLDQRNFDHYWNTVVIPHVTELLTRYGDIAELWFDIGKATPDDKAQQLLALVRRYQPATLVNNRIKSFSMTDYGDFVSMGDNEIPQAGYAKDFESAMTLNNTWGYKSSDHDWKSPDAVVRRLIDVTSKGGNLLLNVGPDGDGVIPPESQQILRTAGRWIARNGEAIYGTRPLRMPYEFDWGAITTRPGKLYLNVLDWKQRLTINGLSAHVRRAYLLGDRHHRIAFNQGVIAGTQVPQLRLTLPKTPPDSPASVVVLETDGAVAMSQQILQQGSGVLTLNLAAAAELHDDAKVPANNAAYWTFRVFQPGDYVVRLTSLYRGQALSYRQPVDIEVAGQTVRQLPVLDHRAADARSTQHPYAEAVSDLGRIHIDRPGEYTLRLRSEFAIPGSDARRIPWQQDKMKLRTVSLVPTTTAP